MDRLTSHRFRGNKPNYGPTPPRICALSTRIRALGRVDTDLIPELVTHPIFCVYTPTDFDHTPQRIYFYVSLVPAVLKGLLGAGNIASASARQVVGARDSRIVAGCVIVGRSSNGLVGIVLPRIWLWHSTFPAMPMAIQGVHIREHLEFSVSKEFPLIWRPRAIINLDMFVLERSPDAYLAEMSPSMSISKCRFSCLIPARTSRNIKTCPSPAAQAANTTAPDTPRRRGAAMTHAPRCRTVASWRWAMRGSCGRRRKRYVQTRLTRPSHLGRLQPPASSLAQQRALPSRAGFLRSGSMHRRSSPPDARPQRYALDNAPATWRVRGMAAFRMGSVQPRPPTRRRAARIEGTGHVAKKHVPLPPHTEFEPGCGRNEA